MSIYPVFNNLIQRYENSAILRGLVQLIPLSIGSAIDIAVLTKFQSIQASRMTDFFDELSRGEITLKQELLDNNEFLHCFFATTAAALKTHRTEKIRFLARLLLSTVANERVANIDEYEEYLGILDNLSNRELTILTLLDKYESKHSKDEDEDDLQCATKFWKEFSSELTEKLAIPANEIDAMLTRLNRSGCYETFVGGYIGYTGGMGKTTPSFHRLKSLALIENYR